MTAIEKVRRLVAVKEEAQREVVWQYQNDPEYRAIFDKLKEENAASDVPETK